MMLRGEDSSAEELRPLTGMPPTASTWQRAMSRARDIFGASAAAARADGNVEAENLLQRLSQAVQQQVPDMGGAGGGTNDNGADLGENNNNNIATTTNNNAALAQLPDGMQRGDIQAAARWLEDATPFATLLLVVFLYRHLLSILTFFWLTSLLHNANERMRRQTLLKDNRSIRALLALCGLLCAIIGCVGMLQGAHLPLQLQLRRIDDFSTEPLALSTLLWDVVLADLCARALLLLLKTLVALATPASAARRLRRVFAAIEAFGLCYRLLLPTPLWFHWLFHSAEESALHSPSLWSIGCSHLYIGFKLVSLVDRARRAASSARAVLSFHLPVGKYASAEEMMELGEETCTICTEEHSNPVRLECGHIYCEECITAWCERTVGATCPLCRAPIQTLLGHHSDGTTTLLPQIF